MIITRTPFRITLGGGGTDLPAYYQQHGGFVFATAINKYMFINVNRPIVDSLVRVKYSKSETVLHRDDLLHDIARESLRMLGIERGIEIVSMADVPAGTGLGSSGCYTVGLLNALHTFQRNPVRLSDLAEEACHLEMKVLGKPVGKQDQYMAVFGGFTVLEIARDGAVKVSPVKVTEDVMDRLQRGMLIFYTGSERSSDDILTQQSQALSSNHSEVVDSLHRIKQMGYEIKEAIEKGDLTTFGLILDKHWESKKKLSSRISNRRFDEIYELAKKNKVLGGKISGAGGGGFFVFYTESDPTQLRCAMRSAGLLEMRYRFDTEGTKVLVNFMDGIY